MKIELTMEELQRAESACNALATLFKKVEATTPPADGYEGPVFLALAKKFADAVKALAAADWLDRELERFHAAVDAVPAGDYQAKLGRIADHMKQLVDDWRGAKDVAHEAPMPAAPCNASRESLLLLIKRAATVDVTDDAAVEAFFQDAAVHLMEGSIEVLRPSVRVRRALDSLKITQIWQLVGTTKEQLLECQDFGVASYESLRAKLLFFGLKLAEDVSSVEWLLDRHHLQLGSPQQVVARISKYGGRFV